MIRANPRVLHRRVTVHGTPRIVFPSPTGCLGLTFSRPEFLRLFSASAAGADSLCGSVLVIEPDQRQVGPGEVVTDAQERFAGQGGDRVCAAVAEVQGGRVLALAETRVSIKCLGGMFLAER